MKSEGWYPIPNVRAGYLINKRGVVLSLKGAPMKMQLDRQGYLYLQLCTDNKARHFKLHILVASVFLGPRPQGFQVNHKDGIKSNCSPDNLEYITHKENAEHAMRLGLHPRPMRAIIGVNRDTGHGWWFRSQMEASRRGFDQGNIANVIRGKTAAHHNYVWSFA